MDGRNQGRGIRRGGNWPCEEQASCGSLLCFSECSEAGVVSSMGYFRAWSWVVGFVQCMVSGVRIFLPATAIISSWHPSGENS